MATEIDSKQVTKLAGIVKKNPGNSERWYSEQSGIAMGQILRYLVLAELEADPSLKIPATGPAIVKARDVEGLRWPRIAARAGISVSKAKELYEDKSGNSASASYSGRGRKTFETSGSTAGTSGRRGSSTKTKAKSTSKTGTSGRRGAKSKTATKATSAASRGTRRGTRSSASPK